MGELKIFSGRANPQLARDICDSLHLSLGSITLGTFPDGENYCKIADDVRGRDVFLIQPTCPPVNDNLMELLIMIDSCKRASASRITAVIPYWERSSKINPLAWDASSAMPMASFRRSLKKKMPRPTSARFAK